MAYSLEQAQLHAASDLALLQSFIQTRDASVFGQIVRRYAGVVYGAAMRVLRDPERSHDVSQETFFTLLNQPEEVHQSLAGWLHRTATRMAIDVRRSEQARRSREVAYVSCNGAGTGESITWSELSPVVDEALAALPEAPRELLVRHFLHGQTQARLARECRWSPATLSRRLADALDRLRGQLRERGVDVAEPLLLSAFGAHTPRAAPPSLMRGLGKMTMMHAVATKPGRWMKFPPSRLERITTDPRTGIAICIIIAALLAALEGKMFYLMRSQPAHSTVQAPEP